MIFNQNVDFSLLHDMNITFPISPLVFAILIFFGHPLKLWILTVPVATTEIARFPTTTAVPEQNGAARPWLYVPEHPPVLESGIGFIS